MASLPGKDDQGRLNYKDRAWQVRPYAACRWHNKLGTVKLIATDHNADNQVVICPVCDVADSSSTILHNELNRKGNEPASE